MDCTRPVRSVLQVHSSLYDCNRTADLFGRVLSVGRTGCDGHCALYMATLHSFLYHGLSTAQDVDITLHLSQVYVPPVFVD